jgi:hypothetical protein
MNINIDQPILEFDDTPATDDKKQTITFRSIISSVLNAQSEAHPLTAEKKLFAYQIGAKILRGKKRKEYELTTDQAAFLKERIGLFFTPLVYGRFLELIGDIPINKEE